MAQLINKTGLLEAADLPQVTLEQLDANEVPEGDCALVLSSDQTADLVADRCQRFQRIDIDFPKFADGRGYSAARLFRERYQFEGEIRAVGDVLIDQLFYMQRVGFSSFALRDDQDLDDAMAAFNTFSLNYQGDAVDPRPLFRKRLS